MPSCATNCARAGRRRTCCPRRWCGPGRGSAATATVTRSSPPRSCTRPPTGPPTSRSSTTSRELVLLEQELSMSSRLVDVSDALTALADSAGDESRVPCRRTVPPCAAVRAGPAHRDRAQDARRHPAQHARLRTAALRAPAGHARRPRHDRRGAARGRRRLARRRPPADPAPRRGDLRLPPQRAGHAAELRSARAGRRGTARVGRRAPRLRGAAGGRPRRDPVRGTVQPPPPHQPGRRVRAS